MGTYHQPAFKNCHNFFIMFSKNKNKTDLPSLITTHFPSCTHTTATLSLQPTPVLLHMALLTRPERAMPFPSEKSLHGWPFPPLFSA